MTTTQRAGAEMVAVDVGGGAARLWLPSGWNVDSGPPMVAMPTSWPGEPPAVVVSSERDDLRGERLAAVVAAAAMTRLADPVIVSLSLRRGTQDRTADPGVGRVEIVVAHRHRGVDVTTVERHQPAAGNTRWIVAFTAAHDDTAALLPLARRVIDSLDVAGA